MKKTLRSVLMFLVVGLLVATTVGAAAPAPAKDPEGVIGAIFDALNAGDVKLATSNVAEDAVLVLLPPAIAAPDPNVIQGKEAIGKWWTMLVADKGGFELSDFRTDGNKVSWKAAMTGAYFTDLGLEPLQAEGVGIVENGLLKSYIWNMSSESMARLEAAMALAANKEAARSWLTAWEQGDEKAMGELLAKDFVNHTPPLPEDRDAFIAAGVANHENFPTGKYTIQNLMAEGDMVSVFGHFEGAHTGTPFEGIPAKGAKASFDFSVLFRMKDGKIAERWATADDVMGLLVPLGFKLVPPAQ
jgi:predicted ester cyclase